MVIRNRLKNIYKVELNDKYFWITSAFKSEEITKAIKQQQGQAKRRNDLTEVQHSLLDLTDYNSITATCLGTVEDDDLINQAKIIVKDLEHTEPKRVYNQRIGNLYFYGSNFQPNEDFSGFTGNGKISDLLQLMVKYPQVDFGWPHSKEKYEQYIEKVSDNPYVKLRALILQYWRAQRPDLSWINDNGSLSEIQIKNYRAAYQKLTRDNSIPKNWYFDKTTNTTGIIWHFTDINNMANILSFLKIGSKNYSQEKKLVRNNNAANSVNISSTKDWVHDYARFYLRPKTPTQYRNQGIYPFYGQNPKTAELPQSLLSHGSLWTNGRLAHLPIPIFIGFSLKEFLQQNGHLTRGSLAGNDVANNPKDAFDDDLTFFNKNTLDIYSTSYKNNKLRQTEFVMHKYLSFFPSDILRIVTRSEAEKIALLTMLSEHNNQFFNSKTSHSMIDLSKYADKIIVDRSFFFNDRSSIEISNNREFPFTFQPAVYPENLDITSKDYQYIKEVKNGKELISISKLKQIIFKLRDVNDEKKILMHYHKPYWILSVARWYNKYNNTFNYYSEIYYKGKYIKLQREANSNEWIKLNDKKGSVFNELSESNQHTLKEIEESFSNKYIN